MAEPLLTCAEASRRTGISYSMLRRLLINGRIASVDVAGVRRVRLSAVRSAMSERVVV